MLMNVRQILASMEHAAMVLGQVNLAVHAMQDGVGPNVAIMLMNVLQIHAQMLYVLME